MRDGAHGFTPTYVLGSEGYGGLECREVNVHRTTFGGNN
jgi:hypothetical protein